MDMPINLIIDNLRMELATKINESQLPMCVITPIVKELLEQCLMVEKQQLEMAKNQFNANKITKTNKASETNDTVENAEAE